MHSTLSDLEKARLREHSIDHLIGRTIRLISQLRNSSDPDIAASAQEAWEIWRVVRSAVVKATSASS